MTHHHTITLRIAAALSLLVATAAVAEPGPESILLEQIGAVRMAMPEEIRQQQVPVSPREAQRQQQITR